MQKVRYLLMLELTPGVFIRSCTPTQERFLGLLPLSFASLSAWPVSSMPLLWLCLGLSLALEYVRWGIFQLVVFRIPRTSLPSCFFTISIKIPKGRLARSHLLWRVLPRWVLCLRYKSKNLYCLRWYNRNLLVILLYIIVEI